MGSRLIVLIDGCMIYAYPPSPTEILEAIDAGALIFGAASLGALRGVELRHHGFRASGWIYRAYLDGVIDADDEVVTVFDARSGRPTTLPLARVRYPVTSLSAAGALPPDQGQTLLARLRDVYIEDRTIAQVRSTAGSCGIRPDVADRILSLGIRHQGTRHARVSATCPRLDSNTRHVVNTLQLA